MSLLGQTIRCRRPFPYGAVVWLGFAVCITALGISAPSDKAQVILLSVPLWLCGLLWLRTRETVFEMRLNEDSLQMLNPCLPRIPYEEMEALIAGRRPPNPYKAGPPHYPMYVVHPAGVLRIPPDLSIPSDEVYSFLYHRFTSHGSRKIDRDLMDYLRYQEKKFGTERVWSYRARQFAGAGRRFQRLRSIMFAVFGGGVIWLVAGTMLHSTPFAGFGVAAAAFGGILGLVVSLQCRIVRVPRRFRQASLVISPEGIALAQADMKGQLRWEEIQELKFVRDTYRYRAFGGTAGHGITLKVTGAMIVVADIYDRPLPLIHQLMVYYSSDDRPGPDAERVWQFDARALDDSLQTAGETRIRAHKE